MTLGLGPTTNDPFRRLAKRVYASLQELKEREGHSHPFCLVVEGYDSTGKQGRRTEKQNGCPFSARTGFQVGLHSRWTDGSQATTRMVSLTFLPSQTVVSSIAHIPSRYGAPSMLFKLVERPSPLSDCSDKSALTI